MHLHDFAANLEKRAQANGLQYELNFGATDAAIGRAEKRLGIEFHEQHRRFYGFYNGFEVVEPYFAVHRLEDLEFVENQLIQFCRVDLCHQLCFDISRLNEAGQWFVVNRESGFRVTYTMASIWSCKVWAWIDWGRKIWKEL